MLSVARSIWSRQSGGAVFQSEEYCLAVGSREATVHDTHTRVRPMGYSFRFRPGKKK